MLAGGLGRRMGGIDKGLAILGDKPLVRHAIDRLAPQVETLLINANRNPDAYARLGYPVIADRLSGFAGPLAGIHSGLYACRTPFLVSVPCDSPFLPLDLVRSLRAVLDAQHADIAIPGTTEGLQPVFALMRRQVLPSLETYLEAGQRSLQGWCRSLKLAIVDFPAAEAFANLNSARDLQAGVAAGQADRP